MARYSAVAYFFGLELYRTLNVPIGLILNAVGGSPAQSWISHEMLSGHPQLEYLVNVREGETWHDQKGQNPWLAELARQNLAIGLKQGKQENTLHHPFELKPSASLLNKVQASCESIIINGKELSAKPVNTLKPKRIGHALRKHGDDKVDAYRIPGLATTNKGTLIHFSDIIFFL